MNQISTFKIAQANLYFFWRPIIYRKTLEKILWAFLNFFSKFIATSLNQAFKKNILVKVWNL
jgi:hypothetical protein